MDPNEDIIFDDDDGDGDGDGETLLADEFVADATGGDESSPREPAADTINSDESTNPTACGTVASHPADDAIEAAHSSQAVWEVRYLLEPR